VGQAVGFGLKFRVPHRHEHVLVTDYFGVIGAVDSLFLFANEGPNFIHLDDLAGERLHLGVEQISAVLANTQ
jgi:hypothetical protein